MKKNRNGTFGNYIIIRTSPDGTNCAYYNWAADGFIEDRSNATGYHSKQDAEIAITVIKVEDPGYTFTVELDK